MPESVQLSPYAPPIRLTDPNGSGLTLPVLPSTRTADLALWYAFQQMAGAGFEIPAWAQDRFDHYTWGQGSSWSDQVVKWLRANQTAVLAGAAGLFALALLRRRR